MQDYPIANSQCANLFFVCLSVPSALPTDEIGEQLHDASRSCPGGQQNGRHLLSSVFDVSLFIECVVAESETEADLASGVWGGEARKKKRARVKKDEDGEEPEATHIMLTSPNSEPRGG